LGDAGKGYLQTGLCDCFDGCGRPIPCAGSGQDGAFRQGIRSPVPRFERKDGVVRDRLTELTWTLDANPAEFPLTWDEALAFVHGMNLQRGHGFDDWRLPNRIELRSLVDHGTTRPAAGRGSPFENIEQSWYWTSTTAAISPAHAWYVEMSGGRMFYGHKHQFFLLWPVRGQGNGVLRKSGQRLCYDSAGSEIACASTGQDGETRFGRDWQEPRFEQRAELVHDRLSGLLWRKRTNLTETPVTWEAALAAVSRLNDECGGAWRLPNINELEALVDCARHTPALPEAHPFAALEDAYWSSTTSLYEPDWCFALYLDKGAVGVGHKRAAKFFVWPVCDATGNLP
jgi:hypothetical protein